MNLFKVIDYQSGKGLLNREIMKRTSYKYRQIPPVTCVFKSSLLIEFLAKSVQPTPMTSSVMFRMYYSLLLYGLQTAIV